MAELPPDTAATVEDYVGLLSALCDRSGLSLRGLERRARTLALPRWLPTSTVSDVFRDPGRLTTMTDRREFVESILRCCGVADLEPWLTALDRLTTREPEAAAPRRKVPGRWSAAAGLVAACVVAAGVMWFAWSPGDATAPATCVTGAVRDATIDASALVGTDAKREDPTLDFGYLHGSAWYASHDGATYYWGRGRSDAGTGGVRLDWRARTGPWHSCPALITGHEPSGTYVRTPAVRKVAGRTDLVMRICLWADHPRHAEKCTATL
ncbi:hypothetical protein [Actinomadura sp. DC4]|uniref:hypothetical protein n=1 Tax=Actinomadura sp. DC4 TaxID=3055069 RepID=UPI0025AEF34D|nr:hypothetical protein [Actinomadura sp. DC4]MDN3354795.1 hypothetical protein [Actinomadura sp. DC4]